MLTALCPPLPERIDDPVRAVRVRALSFSLSAAPYFSKGLSLGLRMKEPQLRREVQPGICRDDFAASAAPCDLPQNQAAKAARA